MGEAAVLAGAGRAIQRFEADRGRLRLLELGGARQPVLRRFLGELALFAIDGRAGRLEVELELLRPERLLLRRLPEGLQEAGRGQRHERLRLLRHRRPVVRLLLHRAAVRVKDL